MPKTIHSMFNVWLICCLLLGGINGLTAQINVQLSGTNPLCAGLASGSVVTNVTGAVAPVSYTWSNGATTAFLENRLAGTYSVTVTDAIGNTGNASITLTQPPQVTLSLSANQLCQEPFVVSATGGGGVPPFTYNWSTGASTQSITVNSGNYCVTIVDANLCGTFGCIFVETRQPTVSVTGVNVSCFGGENGTLTASPGATGTPPFTYAWSNGSTGQTITGLNAGTYFVTLTDAGGCTATASGIVSQPAQLNVTATNDGPACPGIFLTTATAFPGGGTPPYTFLWSTGAITQAVSSLNSGTFSVTVTDANNCTAVTSTTIVAANPPVLTITGDRIICGVGNVGSLTASATSGMPGYQFIWSTGAQTPTIANLQPGTYTVTVTDANGCTDVESATLTLVDVSVTLSQTNLTCFGINNGTASANVTGGSMPYTYVWSTGATTQTISGLAPGSYGVTVTEANNCKASGTVVITQPTQINVVPSVTNILCAGNNTGAIDISVSGGTPAYSYLWSNGSVNQDLTNVGPGTYTVTVTDANGCTRSATATVSQPLAIVSNTVVTNVACAGATTGSINLTVSGGVTPYTYLWSNGVTTQDLSGLVAGTYSVTITDANNCTDFAAATVTQPTPLVLSATNTNVLCAGQSTGTIDLTVSGGTPAYTYAWSTGSVQQDLSGLPAGTYNVTVTDANGCFSTTSVTITQPTPLVVTQQVTNVLCNGDFTGAIDLTVSGGTPAYSYAWSNGSVNQDLTNIGAGTYGVTITDANGCTLSRTYTISQPTDLVSNAVATNIACAGDNDGSINLTVSGGVTPYTYLWSNGATTQDLSGLMAGTYSVTITDANNCTDFATTTVTQPTPLVLSATNTNVLCAGQSTGTINLTVSGGSGTYSYAWSTGATVEDLNGLLAGTYTVTVTDANECFATTSVTITQPTPLMVTQQVTNVLCNGDFTGAIDLTVSGGTPAYSYFWSNGSVTQDLTNIAAGTYGVTITDANGCGITRTLTVTQPTALIASVAGIDADCNGASTGSADLTVTGGVAPYTYLWSNGATTQDVTNLPAGFYGVTVTDANNCIAAAFETIEEATTVVASGTTVNATCNGGNNGSINLTVSGGTAPYTYNWSNGSTSQDLSGLVAGTYSVSVTDNNGCSTTASFVVAQPAPITLNINAPIIQCGGSATGSIAVIATGGTGNFTYLWSNGAVTATVANLNAGIYAVTVTDANGCTGITQAITLQELPQLTCSVVIDQQPTTGNNGSLSVDIDGGAAPFTYQWSNGASSATVNNLPAGTYSVTVTDANGCVTSCTGTLAAFAGIGNFVWEDFDLDGLQDPNEPGVAGVTVNLKNAAGVVIATTMTDANGFYSFTGLQPGTYSVQFVIPDGFDYTAQNIGGDDTIDNDIIAGMNGMTGQYTLVGGEFNMTVDAGIIIPPDGAISDPCNCLNNATNENNGQFSEELVVTSYAGQTWTIVERANMYLDLPDNNPPVPPVLVPIGTIMEERPLADRPGFSEYVYIFRLVDGQTYNVVVQSGLFRLELMNTCEYPEIFFEQEPPSELCRFDPAFPLDASSTIPGDLIYTIAGQTVNVLDPSTLPVGTYNLEIRLLPSDPEECEAVLVLSFDIVENCPAKIGDFVWFDEDFDGIQDPGEEGIEGVKVTINSQDGTFMDMQFTDANGMYMFMVDPGTYKITFEQPEGLIPSPANQGGNDALDSDVMPGMLMTEFITLGPNEMNMTVDAGFYNPCIANVSNPGTIGFDQELCGPGNVPDILVQLTPASGGIGEINYLWMFNTVDPTQDISFWTPVPNSNSINFQPGPLYESTYFTRCVRRNNCVFIESNVVLIEVGDDAVANINGPNLVCEGETVTYNALGVGNSAQVQWSFSGPANVTINPNRSATVSWASFGIFSATLSVTENGCTATRTMTISVINNPATCGSGFTANGTINNLQAREINVNWMLPVDGSDQYFTVERSTNGGADFVAIGEVTQPLQLVNGDMGLYSFDDVTPFSGRNHYRVRLTDDQGNQVMSNTITLMLSNAPNSLGRVFPNPVVGNMVHVEMLDGVAAEDNVSLQLYSSTGNLISTQSVEGSTFTADLPLANQPAGVYFLRIVNGDQVETHRIMIGE